MEDKDETANRIRIEDISKRVYEAASKIKESASQMVFQEYGQIGNSLQDLGGELSTNYDRLSQASLEIVKSITDLETSKDIRNIVLLLGRTCLDLIKGATETKEDRGEKELRFYNELITEIDERIKSLYFVLGTLHEQQNPNSTYGNAVNSINELIDNLQRANEDTQTEEKNQQDSEEDKKSHIVQVNAEAYGLFHSLKMIICNVTSIDEQQSEGVQLTLNSIRRMTEALLALRQYFSSPQKERIFISTEALLSAMIEFFQLLGEVGDSLHMYMNKKLVKNSIKDVKNSLQSLLNQIDK